jgi:hypothetical protein
MVESELTFDCKLQVDAAWKVDRLGTRLARLELRRSNLGSEADVSFASVSSTSASTGKDYLGGT